MTLRPVPKPEPKPTTRKPLKRSGVRGKSFGKVEDRAYRDWIRMLPCLVFEKVPGASCSFWSVSRPGVEVAHVRTRGAGGADRGNLVPLCPKHHDEQEGDTAGFEKVYGLRLAVEAARLLLKYVEHIEK